MHILVSNDDGILAPGIGLLADACRSVGHVTVVAPDREQSGTSHSLTLHRPLRAALLAVRPARVEASAGRVTVWVDWHAPDEQRVRAVAAGDTATIAIDGDGALWQWDGGGKPRRLAWP